MTLGEIETAPHDYAEMVAAWVAGDLAGLQALALDPLRQSGAPRL